VQGRNRPALELRTEAQIGDGDWLEEGPREVLPVAGWQQLR